MPITDRQQLMFQLAGTVRLPSPTPATACVWVDAQGDKPVDLETLVLRVVHRVSSRLYVERLVRLGDVRAIKAPWPGESQSSEPHYGYKTPAAFPGYSLLSAFGQAAPLNLEYQKTNRVLGFPFHFLNNHHAMNVKPANYSWPDFYDHVIDVTEHTFSWPNIGRRFAANRGAVPRWMNVVRAVSSEGFGRIKYFKNVRRMLDEDRGFRAYYEQESTVLPEFFINRVKNDLGSLYQYLPEGALYHDPGAYLKASTASAVGAAAAAAIAAKIAMQGETEAQTAAV